MQKLSEILSENHQESFAFLIKKCSLGTNDAKKYLKYYLKQTEQRNEKRGSILYAARTAEYSPRQEQPSVPGVSVMFLLAVLSHNQITFFR